MKLVNKLFCFLSLVLLTIVGLSIATSAANEWVGSWSTKMTNISLIDFSTTSIEGRDITARTVITPTVSGSKLKFHFSNRYGVKPIIINSANVANSTSESIDPSKCTSGIELDSISPITFNGGKKQVVIQPGEEIVSDSISFKTTALKNIAVSFYIQNLTEIRTMGLSGGSTFLSSAGDNTSKKDFNFVTSLNDKDLIDLLNRIPGLVDALDFSMSYGIIRVVPLLTEIDAYSKEGGYTVSVLGDSTVANQYPIYLAEAINATGTSNVGVTSKSLIGNTLADNSKLESNYSDIFGESLLKTVDFDTVNQPNVKYFIVKIGANDIINPVSTFADFGSKQPTSSELIASFKKLCNTLHSKNAKVILSTITPWKGTKNNYFGLGDTYIRTSTEQEADWKIATEVNNWIKSSSNKYHDGYIDFYKLSKSPSDSLSIYSPYTSDFFHPSDDLQKNWANNTSLSLLGVTKKVGTIKLNKSEQTIDKGSNVVIKVSNILPEDAYNKSYTWISSDEKIATVSSSGKVVGISNGTTTIYCKAVDGSGVKASCKITVITPVNEIELSKTNATVYNRDTITLSANVLPSTASNKSIIWSSSNKEIATVSSKGVVNALKTGKVTITATSADKKVTASCVITVKKRIDVSVIVTNVDKKSLYIGQSFKINAVVYPDNATYPQLTWSTSDKSVASVDSSGLVKGINPGKCTITVKSKDNPTVFEKIDISIYSHVNGVKINTSKYNLPKGQKILLNPIIMPDTAYNKKVSYTSSDSSVAYVDKSGYVIGVDLGDCIITIKTDDGNYTTAVVIKVTPVIKSTKLDLNVTAKSVYVGDTYTLKAKFTPSNTTIKDVVWSSSDKSIATVSSDGVVKGLKKGSATITCKAKDSGKTSTCTVNVKNVNVQSISLNKKTHSMNPGEKVSLNVLFAPSNSTIKTVKWTSSNTEVAKVSSKGVVSALKPGSVTITCTSVSGSKVANCKITINKILIKDIQLSSKSLKMELGSTKTLTAKIIPSNATNKDVVWKSSNTSVITVNSKGVLKAVGKGTATITCTAKDGSKKASSCSVSVIKTDVNRIVLNTTIIRTNVGKTYQLKATCLPENAPNKKIKWSSSDNGIATVSANGVVTAIKPGTCRIKVTSVDSGVTSICNVIVRA